jgi:hypothetical protein
MVDRWSIDLHDSKADKAEIRTSFIVSRSWTWSIGRVGGWLLSYPAAKLESSKASAIRK